MKVLTKDIPTVEIWPNTGQISGLPANPRIFRDEREEALIRSIEDDPEMIELRECIVYPYADAYVTIAGNFRLRCTIAVRSMDEVAFAALLSRKKQEQESKGLDYQAWLKSFEKFRTSKTIPCKVLPSDTPVYKLKAYAIKDNIGFGVDNWDMLKEDWDQQELEDFGMITMDWSNAIDDEQEDYENSLPNEDQVEVSVITPPLELKIEFDDLQVYDTVKAEIEELLKGYPGAKLKL